MKVLSLFDGISGCQQALKNLGIEFDGKNNVYFASEIDKHAINVTQNNFPNTIQIGDINAINIPFKSFSISDGIKYDFQSEKFNSIVKGEFDLLCFGFPCQDISIAKRDRKGLEGARSGLFYKALEILRTTKPKFFLAENVASMSKEVKQTITQELFGIEPIMINSSKLTAQQRKRNYWVGKDKWIDDGKNLSRNYSQGNRMYSIRSKSCTISANCGGLGSKTGLYKIDLPDGDYIVRKLTTNECCRLQGFPDGFVDMVSKTQGYKALGNSFTVPVIEHILKHLFF